MTALVVRGTATRLPLPDDSVDLIVTSPPYFALRDYRDAGASLAGQIGAEPTPAAYIDALIDCTAEWARVLKPSGSIFVNLGDAMSTGQRLDNGFTSEDAAWLAGVIDSDGSISIRVDNAGRSHVAWTRVGQMRPEVVKRIGELTGVGQVFQDSRGVWNWNAAAQQARWVLERVWPWLQIKRRQALAAVDLMAGKAAGKRKGRWNPVQPHELRHRETIRQAVLAWNRGEEFADYAPPAVALPHLPATPQWVQAKSLLMLPERYRVAAVDRLGLIARAVIVWAKLNGLPESVTDRVRRSHEDWVHLTKHPRYFAAVDEIREDHTGTAHARRADGGISPQQAGLIASGLHRGNTGLSLAAKAPNPLGKLPGSVWQIATEPLTVPAHLGVDHFAAFPSEWPRRLILGWSPSGVCTHCGEGRRPVVVKGERFPIEQLMHRKRPTSKPTGPIDRGEHSQWLTGNVAAASGQEWNRHKAQHPDTITGYACACTPYTDHPGTPTAKEERHTPGVARSRQYPARPTDGRPRSELPIPTGPWREYHLDRWTPPPTRPAVVLDPFSGTGTVVHVASALGRVGVGTDLSIDYCRLAAAPELADVRRRKVLGLDKAPVQVEGQESLWA